MFRKLSKFFGASLLSLVGTQAFGHADVCGVLYENPNRQGAAYIAWNLNFQDPRMGQYRWDNLVSSLYVAPGCALTIYEEPNYGGQLRTFGAGNHNYIGDLMNDRTSSFTCRCSY